MDVAGIAAVLNRPPGPGGVTFTDPSPLLLVHGARVVHDGQDVGQVARAWVSDDLVRWEGCLNESPFRWEGCLDDLVRLEPDSMLEDPLRPTLTIPLPSPLLTDVARGELVGVPDLVEGRMDTTATGVVFHRWRIARIKLVRRVEAPWPDVRLTPASRRGQGS